jgi:hypothetical protein
LEQHSGDHPVRRDEDSPVFLRTMGMWWGALLTALREYVDEFTQSVRMPLDP